MRQLQGSTSFKNKKKLKNKVIEIEDELPSILEPMNLKGFVVRVFNVEDYLKRDDHITLDKEAIIILKNKIRELNSSLIIALLRYHS